MTNKTKKPEWYEIQEDIPNITKRLNKHYFKSSGFTGMFRPFPYEVDYEKLLEVSQGNQKLVDAVKTHLHECYFDQDGNPKEYGGFYRMNVFYVPKRETVILDPNAKDWIHVVFDHSFYVKMIAGPVGHDYAIDNFSMNKSFLYSMSKML